MGEWTRICDESLQFSAKAFKVGATKVAVFRTERGLYAIDDLCSHEEEANLSDGDVVVDEKGCGVYCPAHGSRFDLATGAVEGLPATEPVAAWKVKVEEGGIWLAPAGAGT